MEIGKRIAKLRRETKHTQKELADYLNVTDKAVSRWESGVGNPDIDYLPKICEFFGVTLDYLLLGKEESKETPEPEQKDPVGESQEPPLPKKKKISRKAKIIILATITGTLIMGGTAIGVTLAARENANSTIYRSAVGMMESARYADSIKEFDKLGSYRDSQNKKEVCRGLIAIENSKSYHDYALLKEGVRQIYTAGEKIEVTYNGKGRQIKADQTLFSDIISLDNPGLFEPTVQDFAGWETITSFYLNSITTLYLNANWSN